MSKKPNLSQGQMKKSKTSDWTKEAWLAYKDWAERWARTQINWYRIRMAVAEMEARED